MHITEDGFEMVKSLDILTCATTYFFIIALPISSYFCGCLMPFCTACRGSIYFPVMPRSNAPEGVQH
jgi:hypothetical protein